MCICENEVNVQERGGIYALCVLWGVLGLLSWRGEGREDLEGEEEGQ
ncbi:hypothetical protein [Bartonella sp. B1098]|nr:hypothetical protein [Bartonella sp. B1098]